MKNNIKCGITLISPWLRIRIYWVNGWVVSGLAKSSVVAVRLGNVSFIQWLLWEGILHRGHQEKC